MRLTLRTTTVNTTRHARLFLAAIYLPRALLTPRTVPQSSKQTWKSCTDNKNLPLRTKSWWNRLPEPWQWFAMSLEVMKKILSVNRWLQIMAHKSPLMNFQLRIAASLLSLTVRKQSISTQWICLPTTQLTRRPTKAMSDSLNKSTRTTQKICCQRISGNSIRIWITASKPWDCNHKSTLLLMSSKTTWTLELLNSSPRIPNLIHKECRRASSFSTNSKPCQPCSSNPNACHSKSSPTTFKNQWCTSKLNTMDLPTVPLRMPVKDYQTMVLVCMTPSRRISRIKWLCWPKRKCRFSTDSTSTALIRPAAACSNKWSKMEITMVCHNRHREKHSWNAWSTSCCRLLPMSWSTSLEIIFANGSWRLLI